eukprot:321333-Amorphochlora_amoeboformis.AAC.2
MASRGPQSSRSKRRRSKDFSQEEKSKKQAKPSMITRFGSFVKRGLSWLIPNADPTQGHAQGDPDEVVDVKGESQVTRQDQLSLIGHDGQKAQNEDDSTQIMEILTAIKRGKKRGFSREEINLYLREMKDHMRDDDPPPRPLKKVRYQTSPGSVRGWPGTPAPPPSLNGSFGSTNFQAAPIATNSFQAPIQRVMYRARRRTPYSTPYNTRRPGQPGLTGPRQPASSRISSMSEPLDDIAPTTKTAKMILQTLDRLSTPLIDARRHRVPASKMRFTGGIPKRPKFKPAEIQAGEEDQIIEASMPLPSDSLATRAIEKEKSFESRNTSKRSRKSKQVPPPRAAEQPFQDPQTVQFFDESEDTANVGGYKPASLESPSTSERTKRVKRQRDLRSNPYSKRERPRERPSPFKVPDDIDEEPEHTSGPVEKNTSSASINEVSSVPLDIESKKTENSQREDEAKGVSGADPFKPSGE